MLGWYTLSYSIDAYPKKMLTLVLTVGSMFGIRKKEPNNALVNSRLTAVEA